MKKTAYELLTDSLIESTIGIEKKKTTKKSFGFLLMTIVSVCSLSLATAAWFGVMNKTSKIAAVSGDLNVKIKKLYAYKYVYPYYNNSTDYLDYDVSDNPDNIKKYVIEDSENTISVSSVDTTFSISVSEDIPFGTSSTASATNIYNDSTRSFKYYLVGDETFNGNNIDPWKLTTARAFPASDNISAENPLKLQNVVLSLGSKFSFIKKEEAMSANYDLYTMTNTSGDGFSCENGVITCNKAGMYNFSFNGSAFSISKTNDFSEDAIIGNNVLDPNLISFDYASNATLRETYTTIEAYMPAAIRMQNTMVILDAELEFTNANPIMVSLSAYRNPKNSASLFNQFDTSEQKYVDDVNNDGEPDNTIGYVSSANKNALNASDFYCYKAIFTKTPYSTNEEVWNNLHVTQDGYFQKFNNNKATPEPTFTSTLNMTLNTKELDDSLDVPPQTGGSSSTYHCYICLEYDATYCTYFLHPDRLSKRYFLDRDYGFYIQGIQKTN